MNISTLLALHEPYLKSLIVAIYVMNSVRHYYYFKWIEWIQYLLHRHTLIVQNLLNKNWLICRKVVAIKLHFSNNNHKQSKSRVIKILKKKYQRICGNGNSIGTYLITKCFERRVIIAKMMTIIKISKKK